MIFDTPPKPRLYAGLDLGQTTEYTALAILERSQVNEPAYAVRHLQRWPVGTSYSAIVGDVAERIMALAPDVVLAVDRTGVGKPVIAVFGKAKLPCRSYTLTITQGQAVTPGPHGPCVPKKDLVSTLQVLLESRRMKIANALPEARVLTDELSIFGAKVSTAANDAMCDWRDRPHDDLVLAVAIAAWLGENMPEPYTGPLVYWPLAEGEDAPKEKKTWLQEVVEKMDHEDERRGRGWR
jgi:hypothetical protein